MRLSTGHSAKAALQIVLEPTDGGRWAVSRLPGSRVDVRDKNGELDGWSFSPSGEVVH